MFCEPTSGQLRESRMLELVDPICVVCNGRPHAGRGQGLGRCWDCINSEADVKGVAHDVALRRYIQSGRTST
jgi:hypothetical protein